MPVKEDKSLVESDAEKLAKHVCINYLVEGGSNLLLILYVQLYLGEEPGPKILPDSEYPEWLFKMQLNPRPELEDLDPERDGWLYWNVFIKRQREQADRIEKLRYKKIHLQNSPGIKKPKYWKR